MAKDYDGRAHQAFASCTKAILDDINRILAKQSAAKMLRSGSTVVLSVRVFEHRSYSTLQELQLQFSAQVDSRGREWRRAMTALDQALNSHLNNASEVLSKCINVAGGVPGTDEERSNSIYRGFEGEIADVRDKLEEKQQLFRDEWTAPTGKNWMQRHPMKYTLACALAGALLTKASDWVYTVIVTPRSPAVDTSIPPPIEKARVSHRRTKQNPDSEAVRQSISVTQKR